MIFGWRAAGLFFCAGTVETKSKLSSAIKVVDDLSSERKLFISLKLLFIDPLEFFVRCAAAVCESEIRYVFQDKHLRARCELRVRAEEFDARDIIEQKRRSRVRIFKRNRDVVECQTARVANKKAVRGQ